MSVNTSSTDFSFLHLCEDIELGHLVSLAYVLTKVFANLPLCVLILCFAVSRWRRRSSKTTSHADMLAYNAAAFELIFTLAAVLYFPAYYTGSTKVLLAGIYLSAFALVGEVLLHILTCVERYLAVVHPVTYLDLKRSSGVRIRNVCIGCVWLISCGWVGIETLYLPQIPYIPYFCLLVASLLSVSYCSLSVIRVLIRPGPGKVGRDRDLENQVKRRAFFTITSILGVLVLYFVGMLVGLLVGSSDLMTYDKRCLLIISTQWLNLPTSLVLPVLFLLRAKDQVCCQRGNK